MWFYVIGMNSPSFQNTHSVIETTWRIQDSRLYYLYPLINWITFATGIIYSLWLNFQNGTNVTYPSQKILLLEMPFRKWLQIAFGIYQHLCHYYENTDTGEVASAYMSDVARNYFKHRQRHLCKNHIRQRWWHAQLCQIRSGLDTQRSRFSGF